MLEIHDLVKVYPGPVAALKGLSLGIPQGMFGLLGPNGSGKSTLMNILAGLMEPTSGRVMKDGVDVTRTPERIWPRLGYLPQEFGFYPDLSGLDMLRHILVLKGLGSRGSTRDLALTLLEAVNLTMAASRPVASYSGGTRQRLGIAQAIAGDPDLVIVDEPTAGLDPEERNRFYRLLARLAVGRTIVLSTHIVEDVATLCPRFAIIRFGRLLANTTPSAARASLDGTIFEATVSDEELGDLTARGVVTQSLLVEGRNRVRIRHQGDPVPPGFHPVTPSLEDAYMTLSLDDAARDWSQAPCGRA